MRDRPKAKTIDEYLAGLSDDKREALERLRATIRAAARGAEEYFSYGLPAFRLDGKPLVAFGATATHCAFYPMTGTTVDAYKEELENFETSKGTIRFSAGQALACHSGSEAGEIPRRDRALPSTSARAVRSSCSPIRWASRARTS
jgi:uncharacterized protein YdhG (YjbR/CyaY superfamily)